MRTTQILASLTKNVDTFLEALPLAMGAGVVIGTLALLWGICALNSRIICFFNSADVEKPPHVEADMTIQPTLSEPIDVDIPLEIVAVIAAAVATTANEPLRIVSIKQQGDAWEKAGRQSVLSSHRVR